MCVDCMLSGLYYHIGAVTAGDTFHEVVKSISKAIEGEDNKQLSLAAHVLASVASIRAVLLTRIPGLTMERAGSMISKTTLPEELYLSSPGRSRVISEKWQPPLQLNAFGREHETPSPTNLVSPVRVKGFRVFVSVFSGLFEFGDTLHLAYVLPAVADDRGEGLLLDTSAPSYQYSCTLLGLSARDAGYRVR